MSVPSSSPFKIFTICYLYTQDGHQIRDLLETVITDHIARKLTIIIKKTISGSLVTMTRSGSSLTGLTTWLDAALPQTNLHSFHYHRLLSQYSVDAHQWKNYSSMLPCPFLLLSPWPFSIAFACQPHSHASCICPLAKRNFISLWFSLYWLSQSATLAVSDTRLTWSSAFSYLGNRFSHINRPQYIYSRACIAQQQCFYFPWTWSPLSACTGSLHPSTLHQTTCLSLLWLRSMAFPIYIYYLIEYQLFWVLILTNVSFAVLWLTVGNLFTAWPTPQAQTKFLASRNATLNLTSSSLNGLNNDDYEDWPVLTPQMIKVTRRWTKQQLQCCCVPPGE